MAKIPRRATFPANVACRGILASDDFCACFLRSRCIFFNFFALDLGSSVSGIGSAAAARSSSGDDKSLRCSCSTTAGDGAGRKPFVRLDFFSGIPLRPWSVDRLTTQTRIKISLPGFAFILRHRTSRDQTRRNGYHLH